MKRIVATIAVLAWFTVAAVAGSLPLLGVGSPPSGGGGGFSLTFKNSSGSATTGATLIDYGTITYGSGCAAIIIPIFWYNTASTDTVSAVSVGGSAASQVTGVHTAIGTGGQSIDMWEFVSPTGTAADIKVTYSANVTFNSNVSVYCLANPVSTVATASNNAAFACNNTGTPISAPVTVSSGGAAIAMTSTVSGKTMTFTNATSDGSYIGGGTFDGWGHTTTTGSVTVTATPSAADNCALGLAAWH